VPKNSGAKYENLVKGLNHIQIKVSLVVIYLRNRISISDLKVWPNEAFVEAAEFMVSLAKSFENAHGLRLKSAFAEMLCHLLHPVGKVCLDHIAFMKHC
jgi:hypothetical protein